MLDIVQKRRFMQIAVGLLVLLNLGLVGSIYLQEWIRDNDPVMQRGLEHFLEQELALKPKQVQKMHAIRKAHFKAGRPLEKALRDSSELLMHEAFSRQSDSVRAAEISRNIGRIHAQMDLALYHHFVELSKICSPAQKVLLRELVSELTHGNAPFPKDGQGPPGGPPPGGPPRPGTPPPRNR